MGTPARTVGLLAGGHESEHAISLLTSATLRDALLAAGIAVTPVLIATDGTWNVMERLDPGGTVAAFPERVPSAAAGSRLASHPLDAAALLRRDGIRTVVLGLHGRAGEDGSIQGFLEVAGFRYTGAGVVASAAAVDKLLCKRIMIGSGLPTAPYVEVARGPEATSSSRLDALAAALGWPIVVKAPSLGSSVEVHIAREAAGLRAALESVFRVEARALCERFVAGREFTVPVLGDGAAATALPVIEIVPRLASWFDEKSKYAPGGADEIVPARIDDALARELQRLAGELHAILGARGVTRTDVIVDGEGRPWLLEINTLPGMTQASLVPKAARAAGLELPALVRGLVDEAEGIPPAASARAAGRAAAPEAASCAAPLRGPAASAHATRPAPDPALARATE